MTGGEGGGVQTSEHARSQDRKGGVGGGTADERKWFIHLLNDRISSTCTQINASPFALPEINQRDDLIR